LKLFTFIAFHAFTAKRKAAVDAAQLNIAQIYTKLCKLCLPL
jgi:hypothetical protein